MAEMYSDIPELSAEQANIQRRRKIAEMIQAKAMEGIPTQPQMGRYAVPTNPLLALGKIGEAYFGKKAADNADTKQAELTQKYKGMEQSAISDYIKSRQPVPVKQFTPDMMPGEENPFGKLVETQGRDRTPEEIMQADITASTSPFKRLNVSSALIQKIDEAQRKQGSDQQAKIDLFKQSSLDKTEAARIEAEAKLEAGKRHDETLRVISNNKLSGAGAKISNVDAKSIDRSMSASSGANAALQLLDQADALYDKYKSGADEPITGSVSRWTAIGLGQDEHATNFETASQISKDLGIIKLGLIGGSDTERELKVAIDTSPSPDKRPSTNKTIIANQRKAIEILQAEPDFKTQWVDKNGSLSKLDNETKEPYGKAWRRYQKENFKPEDSAKNRRASDNEKLPSFDNDKEARYQAWKAQQGK